MVLLNDKVEQESGPVSEKMINLETNRSERGTSMVEYALLVACIALIVILPLRKVGANTRNTFRNIADTFIVFGAGGNGLP